MYYKVERKSPVLVETKFINVSRQKKKKKELLEISKCYLIWLLFFLIHVLVTGSVKKTLFFNTH